MKLLSLAIAGMVDAHTELGNVKQFLPPSAQSIEHHLQRSRLIRSKVFFDLIAATIEAGGRLLQKVGEYRAERRAIQALSRLNAHQLRDIGIDDHEVAGLLHGHLPLHELQRNQTAKTPLIIQCQRVLPVKKSMLELTCVNDDSLPLAKCC